MRAIFAMIGVGIVLAAASPIQAQPGTPLCQDDERKIETGTEGRQLTQMIAVHDCWAADTGNASQYYLNDYYTRWILEEVWEDRRDLIRDYGSERISPIARLFIGKTRGVVTSVRIVMHDPDIAFTIPLVSFDYSGKLNEGQTFTTMLTGSTMDLPDFRLSPNTSVAVEANARTTRDVTVQSTGIVLDALKTSLSVAAPGGSLLTSVNREQVQRVANAYDTALSRLLSSSIGESINVGRLTSEWYPGASILVSVVIPDEIRTKGRAKRDAEPRRLWFRLSMACPRVSIFDTTNVCATGEGVKPKAPNLRRLINPPYRKSTKEGAAYATGEPGNASIEYRQVVSDLPARISPSQVLNFRVGPGRTVRQYLTEQEWFLSLSKTIAAPDPVVTEAIATLEKRPVAQAPSISGVAPVPIPLVTATEKTARAATATVTKAGLAAAEFCDAVIDKLYMAGLSRLDARIGLWAVATGLPDFSNVRRIFDNSPGCVAALPKGPGWYYVEGTTPSSH